MAKKTDDLIYYIEEDNIIYCFSKDKKELEEKKKTSSLIRNLEIKETTKQIINKEGKLVFLEVLEKEELENEKQKKINNLSTYNENKIYEKYPQYKQIDILAGIGDYDKLEEMKELITTYIGYFKKIVAEIKEIDNINTLQNYNEIEKYNELIDGTSNN